MPATQTAYGFERGKRKIQRWDNCPIPTPGANEVLLKIEAAGICHSDIHILMSQSPPMDRMVMGHEVCGTIAEVGLALTDDPRYEVGQRCALLIGMACGVCVDCRNGKDNQCSRARGGFGIFSDGGFQSYLVVKEVRCLLPIPDNVTFAQAALASDAILTPFHAIKKVRHVLNPTAKVLVFGAGGLGLNALQILRTYGCHIVSIDKKASNKELALQSGASEFYTSADDVDEDSESFDVCFDFVGYQATANGCVEYVKANGHIVVVGMGNSKLMLPNYNLARRDVTVYYNFGGTSLEQMEIMEWISRGVLKPVVQEAPMDELPMWMDKLERGEVVGRVVMVPSHKEKL